MNDYFVRFLFFRQPEFKSCVITRRQLAVSGLPLTDMSPRAIKRGGLVAQIVVIQFKPIGLNQRRKAL